jgi:hypothetical protein
VTRAFNIMRSLGLGRTLGVALLAPPLLCCTWEPGHGFATLETLRLRTALELSEERDHDGALLTDLGYLVRLSELTLELHQVELLSLEAGAADTVDPASGQGACHGEHCHADDGSLVDSAAAQSETTDTTAHWVAVATLPVERSVDALQGKTLTLKHVEPSRELPAALINRVTLATEGVTVRGSVERAAVGESPALEAIPFVVELKVGPALSAEVALDVSRDSPAVLQPRLSVTWHDTLFDGIDFSALAEDGALQLTDAANPAARQLLAALAKAELSFSPQTNEALAAPHAVEDHAHEE